MLTFWDTSAVLPLIFEEDHSFEARRSYSVTRQAFAWRWLRVESEAALTRRGARAEDWEELHKILSILHWADLTVSDVDGVCQVNHRAALKGADAGHLYCAVQAAKVFPEIKFVCFDTELRRAACNLGVSVWQPIGGE